jgi:hypothetical protein
MTSEGSSSGCIKQYILMMCGEAIKFERLSGIVVKGELCEHN